MVYRIGINGFGRIGRQAFKAINQGNFEDLFEVVAVNDLAPPKTLATLLTYDSTYGRYDAKIEEATTPSLEALKAYLQGERELHLTAAGRDYVEANPDLAAKGRERKSGPYSGRMLLRTASTLLKRCTTAVSALRPFHAVI